MNVQHQADSTQLDLLIDRKELRQILKVSDRTLCRLIQRDAIPKSVGFSKSIWVRSIVLEWIMNGCPSLANQSDPKPD
jgi:predicted DNA-binding transcriptional regulator AlpA